MLNLLKWLDKWAEESFVSVLLAVLVLLLGSEVFTRFVLGKSFSWIEEVCRYLFIWSSYIGIAIAIKRKEQLRVLIVMNLLVKRHPNIVKVCYFLSEIIFAIFCLIVFYYSIHMIGNMCKFKQISASLEIDVMYAYLIIPISMALSFFRTLQTLYRDFKRGTLYYEKRGD